MAFTLVLVCFQEFWFLLQLTKLVLVLHMLWFQWINRCEKIYRWPDHLYQFFVTLITNMHRCKMLKHI